MQTSIYNEEASALVDVLGEREDEAEIHLRRLSEMELGLLIQALTIMTDLCMKVQDL